MRYYQRLALKRSVISGIASIALLVFAYSATLGKDLQGYLESAQSYSEKGNLKAAEIELRNAVRQAPQDAHIHALLAQVYLKLGEFASAEREARSARDLKGDETDYLLRAPANRERLLQAVADVDAARNLVTPDQTPFR